MKEILLIIISICSFQLSAQNVRREIKSLVSKIEKYNELESKHVGYGGITTEQYRNFEKLRDKAEISELLELLKHSNSVVKGYTSWALADKMYPNMSEILAEFLRTGEEATAQKGCLVMKSYLSTELYNRVFYQGVHNKLSESQNKFFQDQIQELDRVILNINKNSHLLNMALNNNNANPLNYDQIRNLAFKSKDKDAIRALAKYQRKQDIDEFKNLQEGSFIAIAEFPDSSFWDFLTSFESKTLSQDFLSAILAFKTNKSADLLHELWLRIEEDEIQSFTESISKNYCAFYHDLILQIWEKYLIIDLNSVINLKMDIPEKASKSFVNGLLFNKKYNYVQYNSHYSNTNKTLPFMLSTINEYQKNELLTICEKYIGVSSYQTLLSVLSFVKDNNLVQTSDAILSRLEQEKRGYEFFHLLETILGLENPDNNQKILELIKQYQTDNDNESWSNRFTKLFDKYNIEID